MPTDSVGAENRVTSCDLLMPADVNTASNAAVNFASRSRIRKPQAAHPIV